MNFDLFGIILIPWAASVLIMVSSRRPVLREAWAFLAALLQFACAFSLMNRVLAGEVPEALFFSVGPIPVMLRADAAGMIFALLASFLWCVTVLYSVGYLRANRLPRQGSFHASFAVCLGAAAGIALAANLITFVLFFEVLTLATYPLVVHSRTPEAMAAGRKYLAYTLTGGQALLIAAVWTHVLAPGQGFEPGGFLYPQHSPVILWTLLALFFFGVGVKAAVMPLHGWLPSAMVAPVPVSALLHAVAVVKAGAFGCIRVLGFVFGPELLHAMGASWLICLAAGATILIASLRALSEMDLKRRLAYSTVGQLSYIVLGAALGSPAAFAGALFHMAAHGFMKITLFFCAGSVYTSLHTQDIRKLTGAGRKMPVTFAAFTIGSLGLAGMPLLAGFISKWNLGLGALEAGQGWWIAVLVASALLNFSYFFPIISDAFFGKAQERFRFEEAGPAIWIPLAFTAAGSLYLGLSPNGLLRFYDLAWQAARSVTGGTL